MKNLSIIIGRAPPSPEDQAKTKDAYLRSQSNKIVTWHVDVEINSPKISRQHALIAFNFDMKAFQLINLSHKYKIKLNGEKISPGSPAARLESRDLISIGTENFAFLLPVTVDE
jgi:hypothetical protein